MMIVEQRIVIKCDKCDTKGTFTGKEVAVARGWTEGPMLDALRREWTVEWFCPAHAPWRAVSSSDDAVVCPICGAAVAVQHAHEVWHTGVGK